MGKAEEVGIGVFIIIVATIWILWELLKAGTKGKNATINKCGNCNMVLIPNQSHCPNCGYAVVWN